MTSIEAYKRFQTKINNLTNQDNVDVSIGEFILSFNEQQVNWVEKKFKNRSSRYAIDDAQALIVNNQKLETLNTNTYYSEFTLPENYLDYISGYAIGRKNNCERKLNIYQVKLNDIEEYLRDDHNKPSFEYSETPITISQNSIQVYKTDFSISSTIINYYRYPIAIDIEGYIKIDQSESTNINPELKDEYVNEIIDMCVTDIQRIFEDTTGFQLSVDRENRNKI